MAAGVLNPQEGRAAEWWDEAVGLPPPRSVAWSVCDGTVKVVAAAAPGRLAEIAAEATDAHEAFSEFLDNLAETQDNRNLLPGLAVVSLHQWGAATFVRHFAAPKATDGRIVYSLPLGDVDAFTSVLMMIGTAAVGWKDLVESEPHLLDRIRSGLEASGLLAAKEGWQAGIPPPPRGDVIPVKKEADELAGKAWEVARLMPYLPADTGVIAGLRPALIRSGGNLLLGSPLGGGPEEADGLACRQRAYLERRTGLARADTEEVYVFVHGKNEFGVVLVEELPVRPTSRAVDMPVGERQVLVHAMAPSFAVVPVQGLGAVILPSRDAAGSYIAAVLQGKKSLPPDARPALQAAAASGGDVFAVALRNRFAAALAWGFLFGPPVPEYVTLHLTGARLRLEVRGNQKVLDNLARGLEVFRNRLFADLTTRPVLGKAGEGPGIHFGSNPALAVHLIALTHAATRTNDAMVLELRFGPSATALLRLSALSVVGIPLMIKEHRKDKSMEAVKTLDVLFKRVSAYFEAPRMDESGKRLPCSLPPSQAATPAKGSCCAGSSEPTGGPRPPHIEALTKDTKDRDAKDRDGGRCFRRINAPATVRHIM